MEKRCIVAMDAMGGDKAPRVVVNGAICELHRHPDWYEKIILVGPEEEIQREIRRNGGRGLPLEIVNATETIGYDETPALALRKKKDNTISRTVQVVAEGKADAAVSAGNTGAMMAASLFGLGRLEGIKRPAIMTLMPTSQGGHCVVIDVGANVECKPVNLFQFGVLGSMYSEYMMERPKPRIGLLNVGEEPTKGTELYQQAHTMLSASDLNFVGNIEGRDILAGEVDVVVCDGFTGNCILKFAEGIFTLFFKNLKNSIGMKLNLLLGAWMLKPAFKGLAKMTDYAEYGGAPLLGLRHPSFICHGKSSTKAFMNAIRAAHDYVVRDVNRHIVEELSKYGDGKETAS